MRKQKLFNKLLVCVLTALLVLGQIGYVAPSAQAADTGDQPALVITGTGVTAEKVFTLNELKAMTGVITTERFSTINTYSTKRLQLGEGVKVSALLTAAGVKDNYGNIAFIAPDGYKATFTQAEYAKTRYYFPNFASNSTSGQQAVEPILAFKAAASPKSQQPPVAPAESTMTDLTGLQLMIGQATIDEQNNPYYNSDVTTIIVGEPLPTAFTVAGNAVAQAASYTTADLKMMAPTTNSYTYTTKGGTRTDSCKGILLSDILAKLNVTDSSWQVQINTTDAATYPVAPVTVGDITSNKYLLTYEVNGEQIVPGSTNFSKDATSLRICRNAADSSASIKNVTGITITKPNATKSSYKHISYTGAPYNVDSVTSATLTVEGPGVVDRQIIPVSQLEGMDNGIVQGTYDENYNGQNVKNTYEGVTVDYLLKNVIQTKNPGKVIFYDKNLNKIGEYLYSDIGKTDSDGNKMLLAYGVNGVPLVYNSTSPGYVADKRNDNGNIKLVLNTDQRTGIVAFQSVSRIEVTSQDATGVAEHTTAPYNKPEYLNDTLTLAGGGMKQEVVYSVKDLETMATAAGSTLGYEALYSLENSANYWHNHTIKGVKLYDLMVQSGLDTSLPDSTPVKIIAKDGYTTGPFTLGDIRNADQYGFYINGHTEPFRTGLPVMVTYGVDGYPLVPLNTDDGFVNGVDNNGGPLRITFGQKSVSDINGPNQIKFAYKIIVGDDSSFTTHTYAPYNGLKDQTLTVNVFNSDSATPSKIAAYKVSDLEMLTTDAATKQAALVRDYYPVFKNGSTYSDYFQGIDLWYLLKDQVGLSGTEGTVTFKSGGTTVGSVKIDELSKPNNDYSDYYNSVTNVHNLKPVLAYAKNGYPLVADKTAQGYKSDNGILVNGAAQAVKNSDGPLAVVIPQSTQRANGLYGAKVDEIDINIAPDPCAHTAAPYDSYKDQQLKVTGDGVKAAKTFTVADLEQKLDYLYKGQYNLLGTKGNDSAEYKGISLYDLLREYVGLQPNAEKVKVKAADGTVQEFSLEDVIKTDYLNSQDTSVNGLRMLLAYGKNGKPLVAATTDAGYYAAAQNSGGPLRLVVGQKDANDQNGTICVKNVTEIEVIAGASTSWKHESAAYQAYLDTTLFRVTGSEVKQPVTFTLRQLEAMQAGIIRDKFANSQEVANYEGLMVKYLIENAVGLKDGVTKPSKISICSGSRYIRDLDVSAVWNGVTSTSQAGHNKKIILAYAREGYPLVANAGDNGYVSTAANSGGPLKLIYEDNVSMCIKWADEIIVGSGSYETPQASTQTASRIDVNLNKDAKVQQSKTKDGRRLVTITIKGSLQQAIAAAKKSTSFIINYSQKADEIRIVVPANILQAAQGKKAVFEINSADATYLIPAATIKLNSVAAQLKVKVATLKANIVLTKVTQNQLKQMKAKLQSGQKLMANPVEFKVELTAGSKKVTVKSYGQTYVTCKLPVYSAINQKTATGVTWDSNKHKFTPVKTRYERGTNGKLYAVILKRTGGICTVLQSKK